MEALDVSNFKAGDPQDELIKMWKLKRLLAQLEEMSGSGTSMVTMYIPPKKDALNSANKKLSDEESTASNIKSSINKASVLGAIKSIREKLKLYKQVPKNGLVIFCGSVDQEGKDSTKKFTLDIQPIKPITSQIYHCDANFELEPLKRMLVDEKVFGFVIIDGNGTLFANLQGSNKEILHEFSVMLPKKHGRGGQSAARFGRIRMEKRLTYMKKVADLCKKHFIGSDNKVNVQGLILAGSANFKADLEKGDLLDPRIQKKVISLVDISYGGENGLNEAIQLSQDILSNVKFVAEKKLLSEFFTQIAMGTDMITFGPKDTIFSLTQGAVDKLIVYEDLTYRRVEVMHPVTKETSILFLKDSEMGDPKNFTKNGIELEIENEEPLIEWLIDNYGKQVCFISNKSQEGYQFVEGFGGIGGTLRYKLDIDADQIEELEAEADFDPDEDFI